MKWVLLAAVVLLWMVMGKLIREFDELRASHAAVLLVVDALCKSPSLTCEHGLLTTVHCDRCAEGDS